jgi:hypothetical protein
LNYRERFNSRVGSFIAQHIDDRSERIKAIQHLIDDYVEAHGERPPIESLNRLSDYILYEELKDGAKNKVSAIEYPFLSERQFVRRESHEYSLSLAESYDVDGVNRGKFGRRRRTTKEDYFVDKASRMKNRKRKAAYRRDTSPGRVVTYNLREERLTSVFTSAANQGDRWRELLSMIYIKEI